MSRNSLSKNDELRKGDSLQSNNGKWVAIFQDDGNFVTYSNGKAVWASGTNGSDGFRVVLQGDCNLVMYDHNDSAVWSTNSYTLEANMCHLRITDGGVLELYREAQKIWSSAENTGKKY